MTDELDVKDCRKPWETLYIHLNGDVKPCCYATFPVASLNEPGIRLDEVWGGSLMTEVRDCISRNEIHRICAGAGCAYVRSRFTAPGGAAAEAGAVPDDREGEDKPKGQVASALRWIGQQLGVSPQTDDVAEMADVPVNSHTRRLAKLGHRRSLFHVGLKLQETGKLAQAVKVMRRSADHGEPHAQYWLATMLMNPTKKFYEPDAGFRYLKMAADAGYVTAITYLGQCTLVGKIAPRDPARAVELFRQAADFGDPAAWRYLAGCYRRGEGVAMDAKEADRLDAIALRREKSVLEPEAVPG
jgi:hypothetical protein